MPAAQVMQALAVANRVRAQRAEIKRAIATGGTTAAVVAAECPPAVESMTVIDLLMSQYRWGRARSRRFLLSIPMAENKTLGSMTVRQRAELVKRLSFLGFVVESGEGRLHVISAADEDSLVACGRYRSRRWIQRPAAAWADVTEDRCPTCMSTSQRDGWELLDA